MAKLFCLINNHNVASENGARKSLDYHSNWHKRLYKDDMVFLGCFELPFKKEGDFWLEHEEYVMALDGEILSWHTVMSGKTTMQKLLALFKKEKENLVRLINGNYTLMTWNKKTRELFILNDRMGLRPLYYSQYKGKIIFTSEVKAIISDPDLEKEVDTASVIDFFTYGYILEDKTFIKGIKVFPHASTVRLSPSKDNLVFNRYWDFHFEGNSSVSYSLNEYLIKFKEVVAQAVERNMKGDLRIGLALSGGLDSRLIATMIDKKYYPLHTFTWGDEDWNDVKFARQISKVLKTNHHFIGIEYGQLADVVKKGVFYSDGLLSCNYYPRFHMYEEMVKYIDILLRGSSGDSLFQCFYAHLSGYDKNNLYAVFDVFKENLRYKIFSGNMRNEINFGKERFFSLYERYEGNENFLDYFNFIQYIGHGLVYGSIISRNFLEVRMPFVDYDCLDFGMSLPDEIRYGSNLLRKGIFVKYFPEIARIPRASWGDQDALPLNANKLEKALYYSMKLLKHKVGIAETGKSFDGGKIYRTVLKDFTSSILLNQRLKSRQIFNFEEVKEMLNKHFDGDENYYRQISILLTFELWCRLFLDKEMFDFI